MKSKIMILITISVIVIGLGLSGCISKPEEQLLPENYRENLITIKYVENTGSIMTKEDFPDFEPIDSVHFISPENLSLTLETESVHSTLVINATDEIPSGFRLYGGSEGYNSSDRYLLLQYKVFDNNEKLNDSMNLTARNYIKNGFKPKIVNGSDYTQRIFVLQSNVSDSIDMNVTMILFGYDTILGKVGVKDYGDKSLEESLKILDVAIDRLKVGKKDVVKTTMFGDPVDANKSMNGTMDGIIVKTK